MDPLALWLVDPPKQVDVPRLKLGQVTDAAPVPTKQQPQARMARRPPALPAPFSVPSPRERPHPAAELAAGSKGTGDRDFSGRWVYAAFPRGAAASPCVVHTLQGVEGHPGSYLFAEAHPEGAPVLGTLAADGDCLQGVLSRGGASVGHLRLRRSGPNHCVANFRAPEAAEWSADFLGTRQDAQGRAPGPGSSNDSVASVASRSSRSGANRMPRTAPASRSTSRETSFTLSSLRDAELVPRVAAAAGACSARSQSPGR